MYGKKQIEKVKMAYEKGYRVREDGVVIGLRGRPLKPNVSSKPNSKMKITVRHPVTNRPKQVLVHLLAAYQWFGDDLFQKDIQVRHLDGNGLNNSRSNFALGTQSENMMDRPPEKRLAQARKAAKVLRSLSVSEVRELRRDRKRGYTYKDLIYKYGIAKSTVSYIVNRKTYSFV